MSILDRILEATRARVAAAKSKVTEDALEQRIASVAAPKGFRRALEGDEVALIAEIKRRSPSKGPLALELDALATARAYADAGAAALSVLTEPDFFEGSLDDLQRATEAGLPVLWKDFLLDPIQALEARAAGADAVLVIVRILGDELVDLVRHVEALGMDALVEVFDETDLERALEAGARIVGVNHRDLTTFEVDAQRTLKLAPSVPPGVALVALSGVSERSEVVELQAAGAAAVLVGEALVTAADPGAKLAELLGR